MTGILTTQELVPGCCAPNKDDIVKALFHTYKEKLNTLLFISILCAIVFGYFVPESLAATSFIGTLFLRILFLLIVPIIVVSMLAGIFQFEDFSQLGSIGLRTVTYYVATTALAVATGLILVNILTPGMNTDSRSRENVQIEERDHSTAPSPTGGLKEVVLKIIPANVVSAASEGNVLGLIFFTTMLAIALLAQGDACTTYIKPIVDTTFNALIWLVDYAMLIAPFGVFGLVSATVSDAVANNMIATTGIEIGRYFITVLAGLLFHGCVTLPIILMFFGISPRRFAAAMLPALTTAFSTASSTATLPLTIESLTDRGGVPNRIASFVAPLGATVNMDGTAIYEAVAAIFIANMYGVDLTFGQQFVIFLTATFSAIGAAGIPGAGLIMMTLVLDSVGLPAAGIGLIVGVDRVLDMFRTSINVWGDSIGAAIVAKGIHGSSNPPATQ
jgi:Na+/H+-dicarboxylate symporter